ncbi:type I pullulanase [Bacillus sp. MUM 116]|uniref:type I pullulanase n=1 Tax=Bacillus sp. MUM 116 TaxID=1678002 RepID=UPI0008F59B5A|nr:type I pullulanase [Bacillus sp. MUM 116]OIK08991.1 type I pullulanase [Bacillus sp. MUM 116]
MISDERTFLAYLDEMKIIAILLPLSYHQGLSATFSISDGSHAQPLKILEKSRIENNNKYVCQLPVEIDFGRLYWIIDEHGGKTDLQIGAVIRTDLFDEKFYYDGHDLGVKCTDSYTRFKLWAPTAVHVKVKLRPAEGTFAEIIKMKREDSGVWAAMVQGDLEYYHYTFLVQVNQIWQEAVDPYAIAVSVNGEHGVIVKLEKTARPKRSLPVLESPVDAIIYETHIRDFTIHPNSGIKHKGLYLGAGEINTKRNEGDKTGLSYLKDLGITHIEFLPFHDFAGVNELDPQKDYNWGYNPVHFNAPEGSYATDPTDPYTRIKELKELIDQVHNNGLKVMMDVVYNHVFKRENSSFEKIVPGYYFRHNEFGLPSNGTGVGNDIASEKKMVRKYILDSIRFWIEEYHIDGFRFDLMGIHDVQTMSEIRKMCDRLSKGILLIGEGWNLNTPLPLEQKAIIQNQSKLSQIGQFNDKFRDTIKGSTFNLFDKGYAFGNEHYVEAAAELMAGSVGIVKKENRMFNEPSQSVNYVECHDNHTMWDKLMACHRTEDESTRMKYHLLATSIVIMAQGIPFLHSGQEFFRTKQGEGNSYRSPNSINQLDWDRKSKYTKNVQYIKGLIKIRKDLSCFRVRTAEEIQSSMKPLPLPAPLIGFKYQNKSGEFHEVILVINPRKNEEMIELTEGEWFVLADHNDAGNSYSRRISERKTKIHPISLNIFAKK